MITTRIRSRYAFWTNTVGGATTDSAGHAVIRVAHDARLQFVLASRVGVGVDYLLFRELRGPASDPYQLPPDHDEPLQLQLQPERTVEVQVVDHEGRPIPDAEVKPWYIELAKRGGHANLGSLWTTKTDDRGIARFELIPAHAESAVTFWVRKDGLIAAQRTNLEKDATDNKLTATLLPLVPVIPPFLLSEGEFSAGIGALSAGSFADPDAWFKEAFGHYNRLREFVDACIYG